MKKLSNIKVSLTKEKLKKLKSGGTIILKPEDISESGANEIQVSNLKEKKLLRNHKHGKGFKLNLGDEESVDGEGAHAVGNTREKVVKVPDNKILDGAGGDEYGGGLYEGEGVASYNTFVRRGHSAMNPIQPGNLDQSYHYRYRVNPKGEEVMIIGKGGGCAGGSCGGEYKVGTPFNPRLATNLDQSH